MVGDWITNRNGFPMQITNVDEDYAYATFEGNEGDPWEFDDKDNQPQPIEITEDILRKILGDICTEKTEYIYIAIEKCSERCEFIRKKKRKLAKAEKRE